jgi:hypothetical protein
MDKSGTRFVRNRQKSFWLHHLAVVINRLSAATGNAPVHCAPGCRCSIPDSAPSAHELAAFEGDRGVPCRLVVTHPNTQLGQCLSEARAFPGCRVLRIVLCRNAVPKPNLSLIPVRAHLGHVLDHRAAREQRNKSASRPSGCPTDDSRPLLAAHKTQISDLTPPFTAYARLASRRPIAVAFQLMANLRREGSCHN